MIGSIVGRHLTRRAFSLLSQRKVDEFLAAWAKDAVFIYPGQTRVSGTHRGKDAIQKFFRQMLAQFPEFQFEVHHIAVDRIMDVTGTNCTASEWTLRGKNIHGERFENTGVTVARLRLGKALVVKDYIFDLELARKVWE